MLYLTLKMIASWGILCPFGYDQDIVSDAAHAVTCIKGKHCTILPLL